MPISPKGHPVPYHDRLDHPLLSLGRNDRFTIRNATEGCLILGGTGSGKTSGSGTALREAYLAAGFGGLVLGAKPDEAGSWKRALRRAGRAKDAILIDATAKHRFNLMDYASVTLGADGFEQNLVELMRRFSEAMGVASASSEQNGDGSFFKDAAFKWLSHTFPLLKAGLGCVRLRDVYDMVVSAPKSAAETENPEWQAESFCWKILFAVGLKADDGDPYAQRVLNEHGSYWVEEIPNLAGKTRSSIEATLTNIIYPFLTGKLSELFCTHTTVVPEMAREGKIIILDLPALTYGPIGAAAQSIFKYLFGLAMQREAVHRKTRPVFLWIDEAQFFLSATDAELLSTARSSRTACVFITQDLPTFYAQLGHDKKAVADSIIGKFGTRIFHANNSVETNRAASELVGKTTKYNQSRTNARGRNAGGNLHQNEASNNAGAGDGRNQTSTNGISSYEDYIFPPDFFSRGLRTGGPKNRKRVDAVLVRAGAKFETTKSHWLKAEFRQ